MDAADEMGDLMVHTITIEPFVLRDGYGKPLFGPPITYHCRISGEQRTVTSVSGTERATMVRIFIPGDPPINPVDRVTLPPGWIPAQPPILQVKQYADETGDHHVNILC